MLVIAALTGNFRSIIIFSIIILVHELGHFLTGYILGWKCINIHLYPYGGCSNFDVDINVNLWEELLVLMMGPVVQVVFVYLISFFVDNYNLELFQRYSLWILCFNMLPVYPLDGGKLINLFLCKFMSYYKANQITIYISYFIFISCFLVVIFFDFHFTMFLILILLGLNLFKEIKNLLLCYNRFLFERYIKNYNFKKIKSIIRLKQMKRDTLHIISNIPEKEYLKRYFTAFY